MKGINIKKASDILKLLNYIEYPIEKTARGIRLAKGKVLRTDADIVAAFAKLKRYNDYRLCHNYRYKGIKKNNDVHCINYLNRTRYAELHKFVQPREWRNKVKELKKSRIFTFCQTKNAVGGSVYIDSTLGCAEVLYIAFKPAQKLKALSEARKRGLEIVTVTGDWNGFGYSTTKEILATEASQALYDELVDYKNPIKIKKSEEEIKKAWAKRLAKLSCIPLEQAEEIAEEKIEYKEEKLEEMEERNERHPSVQREKLIKKMERENPLRRIVDSEHAYNIIAASNRHNNTDYDDKLEEARALAAIGELDKGEVKAYARSNYK